MLSIVVGLCTAECKGWGPPGQAGGKFLPGWNGMARTPPMGWRSWNAFGNQISEKIFVNAIDAITAKNWTVGEKIVSLADVGYNSIGIDEGWEGCGMGVNGTQHYVNGTPAVNTNFSDMKELVQYGHKKKLRMGFYQNGCACGEKVEKMINYKGDINYLHSLGFDAVKLDGCGKQRNLTLYAQLMKATGKNYSIENCHWGRCTDSDDSSCPTLEWCPFNWYRSSGDINSGNMSWFDNLQTTIRFQNWTAPVSRPGCWAYPDMLEIGRVQGSLHWNRAHFGAWCIVSSPLILGLNLTKANLEPIIDIITNEEAIAVNQRWAGHPGTLVWSKSVVPPPPFYVAGVPCNGSQAQDVFTYDILDTELHAEPSPGQVFCFDSSDGGNIVLKPCKHPSAKQKWDSDGQHYTQMDGQMCLDVSDQKVDLKKCNTGSNQRFLHPFGRVLKTPTNICLQPSTTKPGGGPPPLPQTLQLWAKPQPHGAMAVLLINADATIDAKATVQLQDLNMTGMVSVRDVWARQHVGIFSDSFLVQVPAQDSVFMVLYPALV